MTVSPADLTRLRTTRHASLLRLAVYHPVTSLRARVDGTQVAGATTITLKNIVVTGSLLAPLFHVRIGSTSGGEEYGTCRYRSLGATSITVDAHNCELPDDAYVSIVEEIKPEAIHHTRNSSDVVFENMDVAYSGSANIQYLPLARIGPPAVGFIDPATNLCRLAFYATPAAFATGATITGHAWNFQDGVVVGTGISTSTLQGTSGAPILVDFPAGERYITYTCTDSNGKTHTRYNPVFAFDRISGVLPYRQIELTECSGDVESGIWRAHIKVHGNATEVDFPPHGLCVLFAEDWFGSEAVSIGNLPYRENIVLVAYIRAGTLTKNNLYSYVEFDVESVSGVMGNLTGLGDGLETTTGTPTDWHVLQNLNGTRAVHHLLTQHSTISQIADCYIDLLNYAEEYVDLPDASLLEQIRPEVQRMRGRCGCSMYGEFVCETYEQLIAPASRSVAYSIQTTMADLRDEIVVGDLTTERKVAQVDFCGEDAAHDPYFSLAPGVPWTDAQAVEQVDGVRCTDQAEVNEVAGYYEGWLNNRFAENIIRWRGNYRFLDIFPNVPLAVNIAANQNTRGLVWTNQRCWIKRVGLEYHPGVLLYETTVEKDSTGLPGITNTIIEPEWPTPPPPPPITEPPPEPYEPPPTYPPGGPHAGDWRPEVYLLTSAGVYHTTNFTAPGGAMPTWTLENAGLPANPTYIDFEPDPWRPSVRQYLIIQDPADSVHKLYVRTGGAWSLILDGAKGSWLYDTVSARIGWAWFDFRNNNMCEIGPMQADINSDGYLSVWFRFFDFSGWSVGQVHTTDYGATWVMDFWPGVNEVIDTGYFGTSLFFAEVGDLQGSSPVAGGQQLYCPVNGAGSSLRWLRKSANKGATWTDGDTIYNWGATGFATDVYQNICYGWTFGGNDASAIVRSVDSGATFSNIYDAVTCGALGSNTGTKAPYRYLVHFLMNAGGQSQIIRAVTSTGRIAKTVNGGTTWTLQAIPAGLGGTTQLNLSLCHDADGKIYGFNSYPAGNVASRAIYASNDEGANWDPKAGANAGAAPYTNSIPYHAAVIAILQCWDT